MSSQQAQTPPSQPTSPANGKGGAPDAGAKRYRATLNLPDTKFPMKANLVQNEPATLKRWSALAVGKGLYAALMDARKADNAGKFVFHDGPPYANGSIHMGHLMNKTLKDFVVKSKAMSGLYCPYIPGWDCHGLPIEHKVMTELNEAGKLAKLNTLEEGTRKMAVRRECQKYAEKFVNLHKTQMTRLLTLADYDHPYLTMLPAYEGATLEVLGDLVEQGLVYRALKPVHWSVDNQTALAEAELEYQDREDLSVYVDFEAKDADAVYDAFGLPKHDPNADTSSSTTDESDDDNDEEDWGPRPTQRPSFMIWTTTPWTLPANLAVAVNPKFEYALVKVDGNITVLAVAAVERVAKAAKAEEVQVLATTTGDKLLGLKYTHPFVDLAQKQGPAHDPAADTSGCHRIVGADYVTLEDGTGLVHTAPGHGVEDYQTGLRERLPLYCPVQADGTYDASVATWMRGKSIWKANPEVVEHLRNSGHLFFDHKFMHSYPHDWRSKGPVIFRLTEQWFVSVDGKSAQTSPRANAKPRDLRAMALHAVDREGNPSAVKFVPEWGRNRMRGMLESRPDWCISRQRAWGLPIPAFFAAPSAEHSNGFCLMTAASVRAVAKCFREKGSDAWFTLGVSDLLAHYNPGTDPELTPAVATWLRTALPTLTKGGDILDVWFESGSSWNAVMRERGLAWEDNDGDEDKPYFVDLYLEGSDQHRGWFQLSLLPCLGAKGKAPFATLLTHGFMVDKDGRKLSKSKGDSVDDLFQKYGADVMRWWVCSLSYDNDVKVDQSFFDQAGESYRKVRNTLRFLLSNLYDFTPSAALKNGDYSELRVLGPTSLDAWALAEFDNLTKAVTGAFTAYDFSKVHELLYDFCNRTLSAIYLAAIKDRLYCDRKDAPRRRATQAAIWVLTDGLCRLVAPVLSHTADEAYRELHRVDPSDTTVCVHLRTFPNTTGIVADAAWPHVLAAREQAFVEMEKAKAALGIENPLDMEVRLAGGTEHGAAIARMNSTDLADLLGVSRASVVPAATKIEVLDLRPKADGAEHAPKCERSLKRDATVRQRSDGGMLSDRDAEAVGVA